MKLLYKEEIFEEYLILKGFSKQTQQSVKKTVLRFASWSENENIELQNISYNDVVAYVNHCKKQGNKQRTLQVNVNGIKHYYNFLLNEHDVEDNPCTNVGIKGIKRKFLYETFSPEELENIYRSFGTKATFTGVGSNLTSKRNKILLGLIIYQGLRSEELGRLKVEDVKLREGKIYVASGRRTNERTMTLEAHQLFDLMDYINETRKMILSLTGKKTDHLFTSIGTSDNFHNIMDKIARQLKKENPKIREVKQLRASVICNWLKIYNVRKVQHLAGHRYVSSTENYQVNNMDDLKEDVNRYHPDL
jgi:site-specific recombinase XerD